MVHHYLEDAPQPSDITVKTQIEPHPDEAKEVEDQLPEIPEDELTKILDELPPPPCCPVLATPAFSDVAQTLALTLGTGLILGLILAYTLSKRKVSPCPMEMCEAPSS